VGNCPEAKRGCQRRILGKLHNAKVLNPENPMTNEKIKSPLGVPSVSGRNIMRKGAVYLNTDFKMGGLWKTDHRRKKNNSVGGRRCEKRTRRGTKVTLLGKYS